MRTGSSTEDDSTHSGHWGTGYCGGPGYAVATTTGGGPRCGYLLYVSNQEAKGLLGGGLSCFIIYKGTELSSGSPVHRGLGESKSASLHLAIHPC